MARSLSGCADEAQRPGVLDFGEHGEGLAGNELGRPPYVQEPAGRSRCSERADPRTQQRRTYPDADVGIDIVIDEGTANDMRIVDWKIQKQYKTRWELVDEMEASE